MKGLPVWARVYVAGIILAGSATIIGAVRGLSQPHDPGDLWLLIGVAVVGAAVQVRMVQGPTARSSYHLGLVVLGFVLLRFGTETAVLVGLAACIVEWVWHRFRWVSQSFNIGALALATAAAGSIRSTVENLSPDTGFVGAASLLLAVIVFVFVNHLLVGLVIRLCRGESFAESGIFGVLTLLIDATLVGVGMSFALVWQLNPYVSSLLFLPLYLIYHSLRMPALERQAATDAKTGLFNARHFREALDKELNRACRFDRPLTVVIGDLDLLRNVNNVHGHLAGDVVLVGVAALLKESVREYDVVARFGGEEFAILMPEVTLAQAMSRVEACRAAIADSVFETGTGAQIRVTMSFGVAERIGPDQGSEELLHRADLAVYRAKLEGRNRVCAAPEHHMAWGDHSESDAEVREDVDVAGRAPRTSASSRHDSDNGGPPVTAALEASVVMLDNDPAEPGAGPAAPITDPGDPEEAPTETPDRIGGSQWLHVFVGTVAALAAFTFALATPEIAPLDMEVIIGLVIFTGLCVSAEFLSVDIYGRETSVSLSGAPFVAGVLLFGPLGAPVLGGALSIAAMIKHRSRVDRFVFNWSIHVLAGLACIGISRAVQFNPSSAGPWVEVGLSVFSAFLLYLVTTGLVSVAVGLSSKKHGWQAWSERFRWLAPYYLALGVLAYALLFGYTEAGPAGVLIAVVPALIVRIGQAQYVARTRSLVNRLEEVVADLKLRTREVSRLNEELLLSLGKAVDMRDPDVMGHSQHVARYAVLIAQGLGLSRERVHLVRRAALLHDIGKLGIPESILFKPGRLTESEYAVVQRHSVLGGEILSSSDPLRSLVTIVRHHHERWDGAGYPDGLAGRAIPLESRILAVADAVEAMASDRPYRAASDVTQIVDEIELYAGTQFDPAVVAAFGRAVHDAGEGLVINSAVGEVLTSEAREALRL